MSKQGDRPIRVAVIGAGYWGPNLIRNFNVCPETRLVAICEQDPDRLAKVLRGYPGVEGLAGFDEVLDRRDIDAVAIATPVATHGRFGLAAIEAGKHVLLEKPMAGSVEEAEALVHAAERRRRTLMVDHTFLFSGAVRKIKEIVDSDTLGTLYYVDSVRINLGLFQHDVNVVWDLAPHDLSILDHLIGRAPNSALAFGSSHADPWRRIEDVAQLNLDFGDGLIASFHLSWLSPVKIRHFILAGSKKSLVYNDLDLNERIKVYDRGMQVSQDPEAKRGLLVGYRTGDVWSPHIDNGEPLRAMVHHFAECIRSGKEPISGGRSGLRVVRILDAAQRSIKNQGVPIPLESKSAYARAA